MFAIAADPETTLANIRALLNPRTRMIACRPRLLPDGDSAFPCKEV